MSRWLLFCLLLPLQLGSQLIRVVPTVQAQLDSLGASVLRERIELGACVSKWEARVENGVITEYTLLELQPAQIDSSDSLRIWSHSGMLCPVIMPVVHWHLVQNEFYRIPSPTDSNTASRLLAPFHVLMSGPEIRLYLIRPAEVLQWQTLFDKSKQLKGLQRP